MSETPTWDELRAHKGHRLTVELDGPVALVVCDECGEALLTRNAKDAR